MSLNLIWVDISKRVCAVLLLGSIFAFAQKGGSSSTGVSSVPNFANAPEVDFGQSSSYHKFDNRPLKFTTSVRHVLVPAIVRDKNGVHVSGLKKEDFHVLENGKERKVLSADEVKTVVTPIEKRKNDSGVYSNVDLAGEPPRRVTAIVIDLVNMPFLDQKPAREAIIKYLANSIDDNSIYQLVAIQSNGVFILHDFTSNTKDLIAVLGRVNSRFGAMQTVDRGALNTRNGDIGATNLTIGNPEGRPEITYELTRRLADAETLYASYKEGNAVIDTLSAFQQIANRLAGIPGRKSMIWLTGSFPFSIDANTDAVSQNTPFEAYQRTMQILNDANIAVYPVDSRGLLTNTLDATQHMTKSDFATQPAALQARSREAQDVLATMQRFATMTGGKAFYNTNDIANAVKEASSDGTAYYMLTYAMDTNNTKQGWRKISVKATNGDYDIRSREGYFATQATLEAKSFAGLDLQNALNSPFDFTALPLSVKITPPSGEGKLRKVEFAMTLPPSSIDLTSEANNHLFLDVAYIFKNANGKELEHKGQSFSADLNQEMLNQVQTNGIMWGRSIELPPGQYYARFVARDNNSGKIGSVVAPLEIK